MDSFSLWDANKINHTFYCFRLSLSELQAFAQLVRMLQHFTYGVATYLKQKRNKTETDTKLKPVSVV